MPPDSRLARTGRRVRVLLGYDAGSRPPRRPTGDPGCVLVGLLQPAELVALVEERLDFWLPSNAAERRACLAALRGLLEWMDGFPGEGWDDRWLASGGDTSPRAWSSHPDLRMRALARRYLPRALEMLLVLLVLRPSYAFLLAIKFHDLFAVFGQVNDPQTFERMRRLPRYQAERVDRQKHAMACLIRVMVRTGKPLLTLTGEELLAYADIVKTSGRLRREHLAWELMVALGPLAGEPPTLRAVWTANSNSRQHSVATLVDRYGLPAGGVRDLLVDYLDQVKPGMDYSSLESLAYMLAKLFWANVLEANPEQADLRLSPQTVMRWHELLSMTSSGKPPEEVHSLLFSVRAFYRDLQQWALEDPLRRGAWAAPCPVRESECRAVAKARRQVKARMQQRTRVLTPLLPKLVATAIARRDWSTRL